MCLTFSTLAQCYDVFNLRVFYCKILQKATISYVMLVRPSVRMAQLGPHWAEFREMWYFANFSKNLYRKFNFHSNLTRIPGTLHNISPFFLEWEMFQIKVVEKIEAHISRWITFFYDSRAI